MRNYIIALVLSFVLHTGMAGITLAAPLRLGVLPAADSLVLYVAAEEGLFQKHGLTVEVVPFQSAIEQAAAVRAGAVQGYFGDIMNVLLMHESGVPQKIVAVTSYSSPGERYFGVAVAPESSIQGIAGLKHATVAIGRSTIVDYMLDCLLESNGLNSAFVQHVDIRQIPVRVQMVLSNKVDAAVLPEPLLSLVESRGARVIVDNRALHMPLAVVAVHDKISNTSVVSALQAAMAEAMRRINADPERYRAIMLAKKLLPRDAATSYRMARFDPARMPLPLPSHDDLRHVAEWMITNKMLRALPDFGAIIDEPEGK